MSIEKWSDLLKYEFAHEDESNHLSEGYYDACTRLGGKLAQTNAGGRLCRGR